MRVIPLMCYSVNTSRYKYIFPVFVLSLLLAACDSGQGDDIDQFIADSGKDMRARVDAIPEVKPYVPIEFNQDGALGDPFKPRKIESNKSSVIQPNLNRPKEPLEAFPLESLKYVGMLHRPKLVFALISTPSAGVQEVKVGQYIGQNFGLVTDISENSVLVKEIVQDDVSGDWIERTNSLSLQE